MSKTDSVISHEVNTGSKDSLHVGSILPFSVFNELIPVFERDSCLGMSLAEIQKDSTLDDPHICIIPTPNMGVKELFPDLPFQPHRHQRRNLSLVVPFVIQINFKNIQARMSAELHYL